MLDHQPGVVDTDGDGVADVVDAVDRAGYRVVRTSGSVTFPPGADLSSLSDPADLDGDGRTDLVVGFPFERNGGEYIVPGSVADGPVDLATDAIRVSGQLGLASPVGDQDGDGADDLATGVGPNGRDGTLLLSGASLMAPGAGGTVHADPFDQLDGLLVGRIPFSPGAPTLVTNSGDDVVVHARPIVRLTVAGSGVELPQVFGGTLRSFVVRTSETDWLVLSHSDRSGSQEWGWDLRDLCLAPPRRAAPRPSAAAVPAGAVSAAPGYTG